MSSEREPLSPPVSPPPDEDDEYGAEGSDGGENLYTPAHGSDEKGDDSDSTTDELYDNDGNHVPSSPPTSIDNMNKNRPLSGEHPGDHHSTEGYRAPAVETENEDDPEDDPEETRHTQREYFKSHYEGSSQWEDEEGEPAHARLSSPSLMTRVQSQTSSRKSPAPGPPLFPARPRQNTGSMKPGIVGHQYTRRSPVSRGSSVSYDGQDRERDHRDDQKKPPLVLLHVTLLLLPGAEEIVLRHLTPTTIDRGVLVEHPRGDYNLLEELILDGLGLDEDYVEESTETEEPEEKTWEQALNISTVSPAKKAWQVRVYASNGLMTPGAWKRVWAEMERIDVEIWPRGYAVGKRNSSFRTFGFGGHSRGTSASNISAILPEDADDYDVNDNRRKSYSSSFPRRSTSSASELVASSAPVPNMPGRSQAPSGAPKSRKGRSRNTSPSDQFGAYLGRLLTPRALMIGAGINLLLFFYFTVFRFINVGAWKDSISSISLPSFGGGNKMDGIQVHDVDDGPFPLDGCVVGLDSDVAEGNGVEGEDGVVGGEETEAGEGSETVADPEILDTDGSIVVTEGTEGVDGQAEDGQDSTVEQEQAADGKTETYLMVDSEQDPYNGARESGEQQSDPVADEEFEHESAVAGEEVEVEERPKKSFFGWGSN